MPDKDGWQFVEYDDNHIFSLCHFCAHRRDSAMFMPCCDCVAIKKSASHLYFRPESAGKQTRMLKEETPPPTDREFFVKKVGGESHNVGQFVRAVMAINNEEDATRFYNGLIEWGKDNYPAGCPVEDTAKSNIGFCFGENMKPEPIELWTKVCGAYHPWGIGGSL